MCYNQHSEYHVYMQRTQTAKVDDLFKSFSTAYYSSKFGKVKPNH